MEKSKRRRTKQTIKEKVFLYLQKKKIATTKKIICRETGLSKRSVDRACTILRKDKKIGYMKSCYGAFGDMRVKVYWGIK